MFYNSNLVYKLLFNIIFPLLISLNHLFIIAYNLLFLIINLQIINKWFKDISNGNINIKEANLYTKITVIKDI